MAPPRPLPVVNGPPSAPTPPTVNGGGTPVELHLHPVGIPAPPSPPPNALPTVAALTGASSRKAPAAEGRSQFTLSEEGG